MYVSLSLSKTRVQLDGSRMCLVRWPGYSGSSLTTCPQVSLASFIRSSLVSGFYDRPNLFARLLRAIEIRISVSQRRRIRRYSHDINAAVLSIEFGTKIIRSKREASLLNRYNFVV